MFSLACLLFVLNIMFSPPPFVGWACLYFRYQYITLSATCQLLFADFEKIFSARCFGKAKDNNLQGLPKFYIILLDNYLHLDAETAL